MALSQHILDSHHSQQGQAGASQGGTWEDPGGSRPLCSFCLFPVMLYDPGPRDSQISWDLDGREGGFSSKMDSRQKAQTGRVWLKEH